VLHDAESVLKQKLLYYNEKKPRKNIHIFLFKDASALDSFNKVYQVYFRNVCLSDSIIYLPLMNYKEVLHREIMHTLAYQFWGGGSLTNGMDQLIAIYGDTTGLQKNIHPVASSIVKNLPDSFKQCHSDLVRLTEKDFNLLTISYLSFIREKYGMDLFKMIWQKGNADSLVKSLHPGSCEKWQQFLSTQPSIDPSRLQSIKNKLDFLQSDTVRNDDYMFFF
jgi:hypothetical protein